MKPDRTDLARHVPVRPPVRIRSGDGVAARLPARIPRTSGKSGSAHRTTGRRTTLTTNRRRRTPWCTSHRTAPTAWITGHSGATPVARHRPPRTCGTGTAPDALGRGPPAPARRRDTTMGHREGHAITCSSAPSAAWHRKRHDAYDGHGNRVSRRRRAHHEILTAARTVGPLWHPAPHAARQRPRPGTDGRPARCHP